MGPALTSFQASVSIETLFNILREQGQTQAGDDKMDMFREKVQ